MTDIRQKQRGMALIIALMVVTLIAILGLSAMRMSIFNARISTSAQANTLAFQAAESAISAVYNEARDASGNPSSVINNAIAVYASAGVKEVQYRCVTSGDLYKIGQCTDGTDYMDSRGIVQAESRTILANRRLAPGSQVSFSGGGTVNYGYYEFLSAGTGEVADMNVSQHNVQEFSKFGQMAGMDR